MMGYYLHLAWLFLIRNRESEIVNFFVMKYLKLCFVLLLLAWVSVVEAQTTKVRGKVVDAETGEPMPLVSIVFVGTTIGVTTDFDGNYDMEMLAKSWHLLSLMSVRRWRSRKELLTRSILNWYRS